MDKVLAKNGVRHNMEVLFSDLQGYTNDALNTILLGLIESFGIMVNRAQDGSIDPADTSLNVTYATPGYVSVSSGIAITSDLGIINVPDTSVALPAASGIHTLYLKNTKLNSAYSTIMNGFKFNPGETTAPTRELDSYEFVWDVDPAASGVVVADVTHTVGGVVYDIDDRRAENVFTLRNDVIPQNYVRTDWTAVQTLLSALVAKTSLKVIGTNTNTVEFVTSGTEVGPVVIDSEKIKNTTDRQHVQNTDTGTTALSFKVGVGSLGPGGVGLNALTEPDTPSDVKNFRIVDISGGNNEVFYGTTAKGKLKQGLTKKRGSDLAQVTVAWGYDAIVGSGSTSGQFTIDHTYNTHTRGVDGGLSYANATFTSDELVGLWLYIPSQNTSYKIISNNATSANATLLEVTTAGGSVPNLTGITTTSAVRGTIHNGCDTYTVRMVPVLAAQTSTEVIPAQQSKAILRDGTLGIYAATKTTFEVPLGWQVNFYVMASSANLVNSSEVAMLAGSYYKPTNSSKYSSNPISYTIPVSLDLPAVVTGTNTRLSAVATPHGFAISLSIDSTTGGWDLADQYEYVYTTDNAGADFANPLHERYISAERWVDVPASGTRAYNIKVRPLLCGQAIGSELSTSVTSGAGGQSPNDTTIVQFPVALKTYSGSMTYSAGPEAWGISALQSPSTAAVGSPSQEAIPTGSILVDEATVVTTSGITVPIAATYTITLDVGSTANFASSGTIYLYRETTSGPITYSIVYSGKTGSTLTGVYTTFQSPIIVYKGDLITKNATIKEFLVDHVGGTYVTLSPLDGVSSPTAGMFVANMTKRGRMLLYQTGLTLDYQVTRGFMDCDVLTGTKARLRWYQSSLETSNDSLLVGSSDTPYFQDSDVTVFAENNINGIRTVIVDAFDDSDTPCNYSNITGTFTLYGRPRSKADKNFESEFIRAQAEL